MDPRRLIGSLLLLASLSGPAGADGANWPNFRGPRADGSADAMDLPTKWTRWSGVAWRAPLPGPGSSTPAVWGAHVFLTAAAREGGTLLAMCLDGQSGKVRWQHTHGENRRRGRNDLTAPSPVTDGERVVFLFGTGELVAYDFSGRKLWTRQLAAELGQLSWMFGYGASPLLHGGTLYVQWLRRPSGESARPLLLAIDPATGKERWRKTREGKAVAESWESYVTPLPHGTGDRAQVVLIGADAVTGHAASDGRELWRTEYNAGRRGNWRVVPTPVSDGERLFVALPRGVELAALEPGGKTDALADRALWRSRDDIPDVCSPLLYRGRLYVVHGGRGVMSCFEPKSGKRLWQGRLESARVIRASPTAGDGKLYIVDESGKVFVVRAGDRFELLAQVAMDDASPNRSSVVIANSRLYVRTTGALYCIGKPTAPPKPYVLKPGKTYYE